MDKLTIEFELTKNGFWIYKIFNRETGENEEIIYQGTTNLNFHQTLTIAYEKTQELTQYLNE